jgi:hypothetical protein
MPLVLRQPNLDRPEVTHLFFDIGDGRIITFFVHEDRDSHEGSQEPRVGAVHHLSSSVEPERFDETAEALETAGYPVSVFDRGIFHSLYTRDHNGLTIETATDKHDVPDDRRGEALATAQPPWGGRCRVRDGRAPRGRSRGARPLRGAERTARGARRVGGRLTGDERNSTPILPWRKCSRQHTEGP